MSTRTESKKNLRRKERLGMIERITKNVGEIAKISNQVIELEKTLYGTYDPDVSSAEVLDRDVSSAEVLDQDSLIKEDSLNSIPETITEEVNLVGPNQYTTIQQNTTNQQFPNNLINNFNIVYQ